MQDISLLKRSRGALGPKSSNIKVSNKRSKKIGEYYNKFNTGGESFDVMEQWYEKYAPTSVADVAIHKKKLSDVRCSLEAMLSGQCDQRMLLLTGPAGCSKSTVVKLLSDELVPKYRACGGLKIRRSLAADSTYIEYDNDITDVSPMDSFGDFLQQARYKIGSNLSVILVEELPNVFHDETRLRYNKFMMQWLHADIPLPPLVLCITECELPSNSKTFSLDTSFVTETIFSKDVLSHPLLTRIKFNPINATLITTRLKYIANCEKSQFTKMKWKRLGSFIKELAAGPGDIRSAIYMLQFWCYSTGDGNLLSPRETSLNYFHAIGKVIYGSKDDTDEQTITKLMDTENLISDTFRLGILENYSKFNNENLPLTAAVEIVDALSEGDIIQDASSILNQYTEYMIRRVRYTFSNLHEEHSHHGKAAFPREWKVRDLQNQFHNESEAFSMIEFYKYGIYPGFKDVAMYLGYYAPLIRDAKNFSKKSLEYIINNLQDKVEINAIKQKYKCTIEVDEATDYLQRIGGPIGSVGADSDMLTRKFQSTNKLYLELRRKQALASLKIEHQIDIALLGQENDSADGEDLKDDPIEDSSPEEYTLDDDSLYEILSQRPLKGPPRSNATTNKLQITHDESLSDSDIENL
ncbi:Rad24p Ecym_3515 [Eremothecium cymbalariae DBVPG|uniref:Checkpoint protein RAD24-like helical bundle domain-containing protein n=1 Tax=Eremothecium cymbalariae (strain CBS 270.75 / DBVPG 7215 / KCTC 17166 / NRRL Y-17582) TaxID=931890 RepID=G8JS74_ERECY|nr:Hypothetical protein Ecym_3515 [Eremothecium cymbalariae DBVPG\